MVMNLPVSQVRVVFMTSMGMDNPTDQGGLLPVFVELGETERSICRIKKVWRMAPRDSTPKKTN